MLTIIFTIYELTRNCDYFIVKVFFKDNKKNFTFPASVLKVKKVGNKWCEKKENNAKKIQ
jgi:hypothetical protein